MATRPVPTPIVHFTHLRNLPGMVEQGMRSDAACRDGSLTEFEVGDLDIRERRLHLPVDVGPGGFVGDYVPFYFGPRSPMMFLLKSTDERFLAEYDQIVYLVTTVEQVIDADCRWIASDRNAALDLAGFIDEIDALADHVSWDVVGARYWGDFADGKERRMAELLVHEKLPWECVQAVAVRTEATKSTVEGLLRDAGHQPQVIVRPRWYF